MQVTKVICALFLFGIVNTVFAQTQFEKGHASVFYKSNSIFGSKSAPLEDKQKAIQSAEMNAIETYFAEAGDSQSSNFDAIRSKIKSNLDRYVLNVVVISDQDNPDLKQYNVTVRAELNVAELNNAIKSNSSVANSSKSQKSPLTFLFVARQIASLKTFDTREYKRVDKHVNYDATQSTSQEGNEGESIRKSHIKTTASKSTSANGNANISASIETGGSNIQKASKSSWQLFPSSNLSSVFTGEFRKAGFKVLEAQSVAPYTHGHLKIDAVNADYKSHDEIQPDTLADVVSGLRSVNIPYLAIGTLDVGLTEKDSSTGLLRVAVTVNAKLLDLSSAIPNDVAVVGPVQYAGLGPTEMEAQTNALKLAAQSVSRELISQLNNQGLR